MLSYYLKMRKEKIVPNLLGYNLLSTVTFMPLHIKYPLMQFVINAFGEDRLISRYSKYVRHPRSADMALINFVYNITYSLECTTVCRLL